MIIKTMRAGGLAGLCAAGLALAGASQAAPIVTEVTDRASLGTPDASLDFASVLASPTDFLLTSDYTDEIATNGRIYFPSSASAAIGATTPRVSLAPIDVDAATALTIDLGAEWQPTSGSGVVAANICNTTAANCNSPSFFDEGFTLGGTEGAALYVDFDGEAVTSFGVDIGHRVGTYTGTAIVRLDDGSESTFSLTIPLISNGGTPSFFGVEVTGGTIDEVLFYTAPQNEIYIGNLAFGIEEAPIPTPAALVLLIAGLAGLSTTRR